MEGSLWRPSGYPAALAPSYHSKVIFVSILGFRREAKRPYSQAAKKGYLLGNSGGSCEGTPAVRKDYQHNDDGSQYLSH
jgi:hypothetical protein